MSEAHVLLYTDADRIEDLQDRVSRLEDLLRTLHGIVNRMQGPQPNGAFFNPRSVKEWGKYMDDLIDNSSLLSRRTPEKGE